MARDSSSGGGPSLLGDVLGNVVARLGLDRDLDDYRIWAAWDEVVGPAVAQNAQPVRLDSRRLVIAVKNTTWMQELTLLRVDICSRLNQWMGREVVSELFLIVGKVERDPEPAPDPRRTSKLEEPEAPRPADLREAIERLWNAARDRRE